MSLFLLPQDLVQLALLICSKATPLASYDRNFLNSKKSAVKILCGLQLITLGQQVMFQQKLLEDILLNVGGNNGRFVRFQGIEPLNSPDFHPLA